MKRLLKGFFIGIAMGILSFGPAEAQYQGGSELYEMCFGEGRFSEEKLRPTAEGVCWGIIVGIGDILVSGQEVAGFRVCALDQKAGQNRGVVIDTVKNYLKAHRDKADLPAYALVAEALQEAYPCE